MHDFRKLDVYRDSIAWVAETYEFTSVLPTEERFGLVSQLKRSAASVPANIAEGAGRGTDGEFARFLRNAVGSLSEFQSHLDVAVAVSLVTAEVCGPVREHGESLMHRIHALERRVSDRAAGRST